MQGLTGTTFEAYSRMVNQERGFVYSTAATGVTLAALGTSTAPFLWNPADSGYNLVLTKCVLGYVSATNVAGHVNYGFQSNLGSAPGTGAPVVSLTQVAGRNLKIGSSVASVMRFAPATVSLTAACTYLCPFGVSTAAMVATTVAAPFTMVDDIDGRIIVMPGSAISIGANASIAVVASVAFYGFEIPIPG